LLLDPALASDYRITPLVMKKGRNTMVPNMET
jgi:hypothetical protein